jgi:hypothetical protein
MDLPLLATPLFLPFYLKSLALGWDVSFFLEAL